MNTNIDLIYDMFHLLANQHSLYELVDCASKILNNPLLIMDSTMNLLAVCGAEGIEDEIWNDFLAGNSRKKQYSDEREIIETMQRVIFGNEVLLTQYKNHQVNRIVSKITSSNKTLGFIVCLEHTSPFPEDILKLTQIVCNAFAIELQREIILEEEIAQKKAIREILMGIKKPDSYSNVFLNTLFNQKKETYYMLCIPISNQKFTDSKINYLAQYIEKMVENAYALYMNKEIAVLINIHENDYTRTMNRLTSIGEIYDLNIGVSQSFNEISNMNIYYLQAKRAVEAGKLSQNSTIYSYPDIVIYDILNTLSKTEDLKHFQSSAINTLQEYDKKHGTDYLKTLIVYLDKCGNTSEIAQVLYTHRNTILHRIAKIEEICKCNLSNHETRLKLSISLKIHNILKYYSS